jgi:mycoredoxin
MKLTPVQRATLARLLKYRVEAPSYRERLRLNLAPGLLLLALALVLGYLVVSMDIPGGALLAVGFFIGAVLWNLLLQKHYIDWWPPNREITDWNKVTNLLADASDGAAGAPSRVPTLSPQALRKLVLMTGVIFAILLALVFGAQRVLAIAHDPRRGNPPDGVVILTTPRCGYCMLLRESLAKNRIPYTDIDVNRSAEGRWAFAAVHGTGVPITIVGDQVVRGTRWHEIERLLQRAGYSDFARPRRAPSDTNESVVSR